VSYTPPIILQGNETMITAMKLMEQKGIKRAAMVKNGQLIGMLTEPTAKRAAFQVQ
jgi:CBS domain-containing protein